LIEAGVEFIEEYDSEVPKTFQQSTPQERVPSGRHSQPQDSNSSSDWKTALNAFKGHSAFA